MLSKALPEIRGIRGEFEALKRSIDEYNAVLVSEQKRYNDMLHVDYDAIHSQQLGCTHYVPNLSLF